MSNNTLMENLYKKMIPVLSARERDIHKFGYININMKQIWDYLVNNIWKNKTVELCDMVDDILNTPTYQIIDNIMHEK